MEGHLQTGWLYHGRGGGIVPTYQGAYPGRNSYAYPDREFLPWLSGYAYPVCIPAGVGIPSRIPARNSWNSYPVREFLLLVVLLLPGIPTRNRSGSQNSYPVPGIPTQNS
eukprot:1883491-Rhodomonas_salina.3